MKSLIVYVTLFVLGIGVGLGAPFLASRYAQPYLPQFLQETIYPLIGTVTHKQRDQDRLLMTITTQDGTILATFQKQVPEIDLLVEEQDSVTLDVKQYEPFVTDPPVLKVNKHAREIQVPAPPPPSSMNDGHLPGSQSDSSPSSGGSSVETGVDPHPKN